MRGKAIFLAAAFAIVAMPALYLLAGAPSAAGFIGPSKGAPRVAQGFIGVASFGQWRLICVPGPSRREPLGAAPNEKMAKTNSCRINQEMPAAAKIASEAAPEPPAAPIIVAANFRLAGPKRTPAAMLRLPVTARTGDPVVLRFDDGAMVQTPVRDCAETECLAVGTLTRAQWEHLSAAKTLQVRFPATGGQWVLLDLPLQGLSAAIAALQRAEISPPP